MLNTIKEQPMETYGELIFKINSFMGVVINSDSLPKSVTEFERNLNQAIIHWREAGLLTVWLELTRDMSRYIPIAVACGFKFHHCQPDYIMLTHQLAPDAFIPPYATHYVGTGGVVLNQKEELLVVVEQSDRLNRPNYYKLPGGTLCAGEHIVDGVIREVREETGVKTEFDSLVCLRHWHEYRYGQSDLYFVCRLSPIAETITMQEIEIHKCCWMPVAEFLAHENVGVFSKRIVEVALAGKGLHSGWLEGYKQNPEKREIFLPL